MLTILPAQVVNSIIDDTVNSQVVMDSSSAPNYDIWVTNIDGPGAKVSWRNLIICQNVMSLLTRADEGDIRCILFPSSEC
jgi:hypothetical protein